MAPQLNVIMSVNNEQVAELFENMATLLEVKGDTVFKIRAYQRAASAIGQLSFSLEQAVADDVDLKKVPGIGKAISEKIHELLDKQFDMPPPAIIRDLDLRRPIYQPTAAYGHFGRDGLNLSWEQTDKADALRADAGL